MPQRRILCLLSALWWLLSPTQAQAQTTGQDTPPRTASLSGRVLVNGAAMPNAIVTISELETSQERAARAAESLKGTPAVPKRKPTYQVRTDAEGRYTLAQIPAGQYQIRPLSRVYVLAQASANKAATSQQTITLNEGEARTNVDFSLVRGGVITGRLSDQEDRPLISYYAQLSILNQNGQPESVGPSNRNRTETDDRGVYRFYGLPPGRYVLSAGGDGFTESTSKKYPLTYHPNATELSRARILEIKEGEELTEINIRLGPARKTYEAIGRVIDASSGQPLPQIAVSCLTAPNENSPNTFGGGRAVTSDSRGIFRIPELSSGKYRLEVMSSTSFAAQEGFYAEPVTFEIDESNLNGLELKARRGSTLSGSVVVEGSPDAETKRKLAQNRISSSQLTQQYGSFSPPPAAINADGSFQITGLGPGKISLSIFPYTGGASFLLQRIEHQGVEVRDGIEIRAGENVTGVRLILGQGTGAIRGVVKIINGVLSPHLVLYAQAHRVESRQGFGDRYAAINDKGQFLLSGLPPGEYELAAGVRPANFTAAPPAKLPRAVKQLITVTNGEEKSIVLTLDLNATEEEKQ